MAVKTQDKKLNKLRAINKQRQMRELKEQQVNLIFNSVIETMNKP